MSRHRRKATLDWPRQVVSKGPPHQTGRFSLDYASWRAHLAAPGSRLEAAQSDSRRIVYLDAETRLAISANDERRAA